MRWLLALISDTGMRLAEAAGLHKDDIILDVPVPYIDLKAHPWRRLKTKSSGRHMPLIGASLWAVQRLQKHDSSYAFPRYCDGKTCNANSASAALNKWMKKVIYPLAKEAQGCKRDVTEVANTLRTRFSS